MNGHDGDRDSRIKSIKELLQLNNSTVDYMEKPQF